MLTLIVAGVASDVVPHMNLPGRVIQCQRLLCQCAAILHARDFDHVLGPEGTHREGLPKKMLTMLGLAGKSRICQEGKAEGSKGKGCDGAAL